MCCNHIDIPTSKLIDINKNILKRRAPAANYEHAVVQYQSQTIGVYGPYQVNDYISKDADQEIYCLR